MRLICWNYVLPRLLALVLVVLGAELAAGLVTQRSLVSLGQRIARARVEVARSRASLWRTEVELDEIRVANRQDPMTNLIEAERLELNFDAASLLRRKAVISQATLRGVRFDTPRQTSGELPDSDTNPEQWTLDLDFGGAAAKVGQWWDGLIAALDEDLAQQFESVRLAQQLAERWPDECAQLEEQIEAVLLRTKELETSIQSAQENPLRHADVLERLPREIKALHKSLGELTARVESLPMQVAEDRDAILTARLNDEQMLRKRLRVDQIESSALAAYLLHERLRTPVSELVRWVRWSREFSSEAQSEPELARRRGTDIAFANCRQTPDLLIQSLQLEGTARLGGRPVEVSGTLSNFTWQPALHDTPMRLELTAEGSLPLRLVGTFDRTAAPSRDELILECPDLSIPSLKLGSDSHLAVVLPPSRGTIVARVDVVDEQLSGEVHFAQNPGRPTVVVGEALRDWQVETALERALGELQVLKTGIVLSGTLANPELELHSNIAPALNEAIAATVERTASAKADQLLAESRRYVDQQVGEVDRMVDERTAALVEALRGPSDRVAGLAKSFAADRGLNFEELGRRLPANSLFR